jgi:hypothetical protein
LAIINIVEGAWKRILFRLRCSILNIGGVLNMKRASSREGLVEHQEREEQPMPRTQRQQRDQREMERERWEKSVEGEGKKNTPRP